MEIVLKYFPHLTSRQIQQLELLESLYQDWNLKINVVSRKDIDELYIRHVLHSLAIARFIQFLPGSRVMDLGTGGGFPGIPLAIFFPQVQFLLVDSIGKKIKVVEEIAGALDLHNVRAKAARVEQVNEQFDFIVTRAVAKSSKLKTWTRGKLLPKGNHQLPNGIIALKGGDLSAELKEVKAKKIKQVNISSYFQESFFETKKIVYIGF